MKFSTKTRYGLRAMMEIALADKKTGIFQKDIAFNQELSVKYLDHIIHALKVEGLISNVKGKKSGYILTRPSQKITIYDIHNAFENGICVIDCISLNVKCKREKNCSAKGFWNNLNKQIIAYFKSVTLNDLITENVIIDN